MIQNILVRKINHALSKLNVESVGLSSTLDHPANPEHGDYATSIALKLAKKLGQQPLPLAQSITSSIEKGDDIEKIEIIPPGFINFFLAIDYLKRQAQQMSSGEFSFPCFHFGREKKIMVEFAHPNTHKLFHIGHLRNISIGESIARILEALGNKVIRANYQGDVGLHIAKCLYKVKSQKLKVTSLKTLKEKIDFIGKMYSEGTKSYEENESAREEIIEINRMIYARDPEITDLWKKTVQWSLDYFDEVYRRVDTHFNRLYFESECFERGADIARELEKKGILTKSQGALVFSGKQYDVDTRVFINSLGFPTYEAKELALAEKEFSEFGNLDKCIHVVTPEQTSFFKVTFKVEELINEKKYKGKQHHLSYNWIQLKQGKMSSRLGNIIEGPWLIDEAKKKIKKLFSCDDDIAEALAVASVKYSFLKHATRNEISFDLEESVQLEGNSAPYIIYTYVRTQSVLKNQELTHVNPTSSSINKEEESLLRLFYRFPQVVENAGSNMEPSAIAHYLFELAQRYNLFYQKHPILKALDEQKNLRLIITRTTGHIIKKGLYLMGIKTVEKM